MFGTKTPVAPPPSTTPWMDIAKRYEAKKVHELRGGEDPDIIKFFEEIGKPEFDEDEVPWCAAFIGGCLYEANYGHNGSAWAADYASWHQGADRVQTPRYGDIAVMNGHVTFFVKDNGDGTFGNLGGNQSDAVTFSRSSFSGVIAFMRPNGKGTPKLPIVAVPAKKWWHIFQ